jgi:hypothetical protein
VQYNPPRGGGTAGYRKHCTFVFIPPETYKVEIRYNEAVSKGKKQNSTQNNILFFSNLRVLSEFFALFVVKN